MTTDEWLTYQEAKQRTLRVFDAAYFSILLDRCEGNVSKAARMAGMDRSNFRREAKRAGIKLRGESAPIR